MLLDYNYSKKQFFIFRGACLSSTDLVSHSVCLSVCHTFPDLALRSIFSSSFQFCQVLLSPLRSFQVLPGPFKSFQVPPSTFKSFQFLSSPFMSFQVLPSPFGSFQVLSSPFISFQVLTNNLESVFDE